MKRGVSIFETADTAARARGRRARSSSWTSVVLVASLQTLPLVRTAVAVRSPRARARRPDARFAVARDADRGRRSRRHVHAGVPRVRPRLGAARPPRAGSTTRSSSPARPAAAATARAGGGGPRGGRRVRELGRGARGVDDARRPTRAERGAPRRRPARTRRVPGRVAPAGGHRRRVSALGNRRRGVSSSPLLLRRPPPPGSRTRASGSRPRPRAPPPRRRRSRRF